MRRIRTTLQFEGWYATAPSGAVACYHSGLLMADRRRTGRWARLGVGLTRLADHVLLYADCGRVRIAQQRRADGRMDYLVIRGERPGASWARAGRSPGRRGRARRGVR